MLKFLGSGGAFHTERGNNSAYFVLANELFLFDCGEDVFAKLRKANLLENKSRINIFVTHLHGDHAGSLGTTIAYLYYMVYNQDMSNICIYYPNESIKQFLKLQGVPETWYNLFSNRWDELFLPGFKVQPEYSFEEVPHTKELDYRQQTTSYAIEFSLQDQFSFYYSGDTSEFQEKLKNVYQFDYIYHEVTSEERATVHTSYHKLLEATKNLSKEERSRIYLMHIDENFDCEQAKKDGFQVVENVEL